MTGQRLTIERLSMYYIWANWGYVGHRLNRSQGRGQRWDWLWPQPLLGHVNIQQLVFGSGGCLLLSAREVGNPLCTLKDVNFLDAFWKHIKTGVTVIVRSETVTGQLADKLIRGQWSLLLLPDYCQPQEAKDSDTLNVQSVPVQTMLLLSCADSKNRSHTTGYSRQERYSLVTEGQYEYLFLNLGTDGSTLEGIQSASLNHWLW